ncbi:MAG: hypothetical protein ACTSXD_13490 [Candidatus Heimdallarchaeaceae archaeon]
MEKIPWWEGIGMCKGRTKTGKRCKLPCRRPYLLETGELYIPLTCHLHKNQEKEIRKRLGLEH